SRPALLHMPVLAPTPISTLSLHAALPISAPMQVTSLALHGGSQDFSLVVGDEGIPSAPLPPNGSFQVKVVYSPPTQGPDLSTLRSEEHTSELQSRENLVCRLLLEKKDKKT